MPGKRQARVRQQFVCRQIARLAPVEDGLGEIVGGNISRDSCKKEPPARRANPAEVPAGAAATSNAGFSRSTRIGVLLIGSLLATALPIHTQCSSCTSTMPARTAASNAA